MLFHVEWEVLPHNRNLAQERFKETGAVPPEGVVMKGRWHSVAGSRGFLIAESEDAVAIGKWMQGWTDLLSFDITPVVSDQELVEIFG